MSALLSKRLEVTQTQDEEKELNLIFLKKLNCGPQKALGKGGS